MKCAQCGEILFLILLLPLRGGNPKASAASALLVPAAPPFAGTPRTHPQLDGPWPGLCPLVPLRQLSLTQYPTPPPQYKTVTPPAPDRHGASTGAFTPSCVGMRGHPGVCGAQCAAAGVTPVTGMQERRGETWAGPRPPLMGGRSPPRGGCDSLSFNSKRTFTVHINIYCKRGMRCVCSSETPRTAGAAVRTSGAPR